MADFLRGGGFRALAEAPNELALSKRMELYDCDVEIFDFTGANKQMRLTKSVSNAKYGAGNDLSFREATLRVLSAMKVFTTVFGMGTGGFLSLCYQQNFLYAGSCIMKLLITYAPVKFA